MGGSIFTIIAIKDPGEVSNLLTFECLGLNEANDFEYIKRCGFNHDPENIPISEVINIRTEKDYYERSYSEIDLTISYLFIFLLELDPL